MTDCPRPHSPPKSPPAPPPHCPPSSPALAPALIPPQERRKELRQTLRQDRAFMSGLQAYVLAADVNPQLRWMNGMHRGVPTVSTRGRCNC